LVGAHPTAPLARRVSRETGGLLRDQASLGHHAARRPRAHRGGRLRRAFERGGDEGESRDPAAAGGRHGCLLDARPDQNQGETFWGVFDELLRLTPDRRIVPNLAQSVTKPGPAVYVYHLHHGVKFWDGHELTADDVADSLNYYRYPTFQTSAYYRSVKSIVPKGKYTVVVTLKHVDSSWDSVLSWQGPIFEKAFQQAHKKTFGQPGTGVMGTGAFEVASFDPTTGLELKANPHWWRGAVNVKRVSWRFFQNETSEALAFRAGQSDIAFPFDAKAFASTAATKLINVPSNTTGYFGMNFQQAPFNDVHVSRVSPTR
jgi:peptide/nickel transport system substrate-binding protein